MTRRPPPATTVTRSTAAPPAPRTCPSGFVGTGIGCSTNSIDCPIGYYCEHALNQCCYHDDQPTRQTVLDDTLAKAMTGSFGDRARGLR